MCTNNVSLASTVSPWENNDKVDWKSSFGGMKNVSFRHIKKLNHVPHVHLIQNTEYLKTKSAQEKSQQYKEFIMMNYEPKIQYKWSNGKISKVDKLNHEKIL